MTSNQKPEPDTGESKTASKRKDPEWTSGLRQLYDSVVDEPLPDSFKNLLDQFDETSQDQGDGTGQRSSGGESAS